METDRGPCYLLISREDYKLDTGWCTIGGRMRIDETFEIAVSRHLVESLGAGVSWAPRDWSRPDLVVDFRRGTDLPGPLDARKHSISLMWVLELQGEAVPGRGGEGASTLRAR